VFIFHDDGHRKEKLLAYWAIPSVNKEKTVEMRITCLPLPTPAASPMKKPALCPSARIL